MSISIENVFVTEGFPSLTFVKPPNYNNILIDIKKKGKPVIIEGQSGIGKTTTILKVIEDLHEDVQFKYLSGRKRDDIAEIFRLTREPDNGNYIIDDFHRLADIMKKTLSDYAKIAADEGDLTNYPKLVLIGINQVGNELLSLSPDIRKRCGIHTIQAGSWDSIKKLITIGEEQLNIKFLRPKVIFNESKGDYWLTQVLCQFACIRNDVLKTQDEEKLLSIRIKDVRKELVVKLKIAYNEVVKKFCRGKRWRPTNDSYFITLKAVSDEDVMPIDLSEIANRGDEMVRTAVNKIKEVRLSKHISDAAELSSNFYYNKETHLFNIEDPALSYYIKHLDWRTLKKECGFKTKTNIYKFDVAISFAGENRALADYITTWLRIFDYEVFYDELYEANYLGSSWTTRFEDIFNKESRYVLCILDEFHKDKIWPTFERECFQERVKDESVIPIFLDKTKFVGIPQDIIGMKFKYNHKIKDPSWKDRVRTEILSKLMVKID